MMVSPLRAAFIRPGVQCQDSIHQQKVSASFRCFKVPGR